MKGGVTKRIEDTLKALDQGQLKKALLLTDGVLGLEKHHQWLQEAGQACLADKQACDAAISIVKARVKGTVELPEDDTSLEGLEDLVKGGLVPVSSDPEKEDPAPDCEECHVADAVGQFYAIAEGCGNTEVLTRIDQQVKNPDTPAPLWLKTMVEIAESASCGQDAYSGVLVELTDYLEERGSPILQALDEGGEDGQQAAVSARAEG
jgi:hypothetical protein